MGSARLDDQQRGACETLVMLCATLSGVRLAVTQGAACALLGG